MTRRLIDWFGKKTAIWKGTCTKCGEIYRHRGTEPTQTRCKKIGCDGTIVWQIEEL
jgi:hypothetical protein